MEAIALAQKGATTYGAIKGTIDRKISTTEVATLLGISRREVIR
jgi:hypothetical protein